MLLLCSPHQMCLLLSLSLSKSSGGVAFHRPRRRSLFVVTKAVSSSSSPKKRDATPKEENDSTLDVSALSNPSKTANTTGFDSTAFSAFERRFSGGFGAVAREYALREEEKDDVDEKAWWWEGLEIPSRYVHGVGVVPKSSMPFADALYEANARATSRFETTSSNSDFFGEEDGSSIACKYCEIETKRSFPEVGEQESMGSCGGSEWNERTRYAEDRKYFLLRGEGGEEARTVDESGSFTAGPKTLSRNSSDASNSSVTTSNSSSGGEEEEEEDFAMTWFPTHETESSVRFGLQWEDGKRVRVDYHVKKKTGRLGCVLWSERKGACAPRSGEEGVRVEQQRHKKEWSNANNTWSILRERAFVLEEDINTSNTKFANVPPNSSSLAAISSESLLLFEQSNIALRCGEDFIYVSGGGGVSPLNKVAHVNEENAATCFAAGIEIGGKMLLWTRVYDGTTGAFKFAHFAELVVL